MEKENNELLQGGRGKLTIRKAEYTTLLAVGMTWPPPRWRGSWATRASRILNLTFLMADGSRESKRWENKYSEEKQSSC